MIKKKGIKKVDWLTNSPNLYLIEDIWDREKEMLNPKWNKLKETGKRVQEIARRDVAKVQRSDEIFTEVQYICESQRAKLELCKELKGKNNFRR